jgi:hypothetical protein
VTARCGAVLDTSPWRDDVPVPAFGKADILPIVAREVPDLPRPLKNWGAPEGGTVQRVRAEMAV